MILELALTRTNSPNLEDLDQSADLAQVEEPDLKPSGGLSVSLRASSASLMAAPYNMTAST